MIGYLDDSKLTAIANSIRSKTGSAATMTVDDMPTEIAGIAPATPTQTKSVTINSNTTTVVRPDTGYDLSEVTITTAVPGGASDVQAIGQELLDIQNRTNTVLDLSSQNITYFNGLSNYCTQITLPSTVTKLDSYSCSMRPRITGTTLVIPKSVTEIDRYAFSRQISGEQDAEYNWIFSFEGNRTNDLNLASYSFSYCKAASLVLPQETVLAGQADNTFNNSYIKNIDMSACTGITALGYQTFYYCEKLESIILPPNLQSIGRSNYSGQATFNFCTSLSTLTIPATVTSIQGDYTLLPRRYNKTTFHFLGTTPPTRIGNIFGYSSHISSFIGTIYVPYSADHSVLNAYRNNSSWSDVASHFQEEPAS